MSLICGGILILFKCFCFYRMPQTYVAGQNIALWSLDRESHILPTGMRTEHPNPSAAAAKKIFSMTHQMEAKEFRELTEVG